jgi:thiamine-monophosphate kinase
MARRRVVKTLAETSEDALLPILLQGMPEGKNLVLGPGDDCAAMSVGGSRDLILLKCDAMVEGVHYLQETPPERVGWKALCRPLSDIAAMGGEPTQALVSIFSPSDRTVDYWKGFYKGMAKAAKAYGIGLAGGETSRSDTAAVSVFLTGRIEPLRLIRRSGGRPGDTLFVTGSLGGSITGKHLTFKPRLAEGRWLGGNGYARAMMDLSDGLATDLPRLAAASECGYNLKVEDLPRSRGCSIEQALIDGEDYELLFACPPGMVARLKNAWPNAFPKVRLTAIGTLVEAGSSSTPLPRGFDHFFSCQAST